MPLHDVTTLTEAFRRAVLRLFVRRELWMSRRPTVCSPGRTRGFTCMMGCDALVGESRAHEPGAPVRPYRTRFLAERALQGGTTA